MRWRNSISAACSNSSGMTAEAISHLARAVELAPSLADAHLNLALAYEKSGQVTERASPLVSVCAIRAERPVGGVCALTDCQVPASQSASPPSGKLTPFRRIH